MRALLFGLIVVSTSGSGAQAPDADAMVREAIIEALRSRMGTDAEVVIERLRLPDGWPHGAVQARPDPGARLGRPMRFALGAAPDRTGAAVAWSGVAEADVHVQVPHLHTRRAVPRGATITEADVALVRHAVDGALRAWPAADAIGRSRALRDVGPDTCLVPASLAMAPLVRAGQEVQATARVGVIVAQARLVAADRGEIGSVIRVVNPRSRRTLKARVVGAGMVEVIHD